MAERVFEPMSVGQILDRTFRIYREDFLHFVTIVAVIQVPVALLRLAVPRLVAAFVPAGGGASGGAVVAAVVGGLVAFFLLIIAQSLSSGALVKSVSEAYLGNEVSVGEAYRFVLPKVGTLVWASILVFVVVLIGYMLLIVPGVIFSLWLMLTTQAIIVEGRPASAAMGRSKALTSGNLGKVFGLAFVIFIISIIISAVFTFVGGLAFAGALAAGATVASLVSEIISVIGQILVAPISATAFILLYYDLRIRKEGFDLEMLAQTMGAREA
jgi:hypothetical protein